jgi:hypothetical protein
MIHSAIVDPQSSRQRKLPIPSAISSSSPTSGDNTDWQGRKVSAADRSQKVGIEPVGKLLCQFLEDRQRVEAEGEFYRQLTARPWAVAIDAAKIPDQPDSTPILLTKLGEILRSPFTCGTRRFPSSPNTEPAGAA